MHVPYRGGARRSRTCSANEIVFMFYPYAALLPHIKARTLRALGTTAKIAALPDVPTPRDQSKLVRRHALSTFASLSSSLSQPMAARLVHSSLCIASKVSTIWTPCGVERSSTMWATS